MKKVQGALLGVVVLLAGLVVLLALRNPQPPILPADDYHRARPVPAACLDCHGPDGEITRSKNHPVGNDCLRCHGLP